MKDLKIFLNGIAEKNFKKLESYGLIQYLILTNPNGTIFSSELIKEALRNTDKRFGENKSITPGFLIAAMLWPELIKRASKNDEINLRKFFRSMDQVLKNQQNITAIPRKFHTYIKDIWILQLKLHIRIVKQKYKNLKNTRFRAAYDFLLIR